MQLDMAAAPIHKSNSSIRYDATVYAHTSTMVDVPTPIAILVYNIIFEFGGQVPAFSRFKFILLL